MRARVDYAGLGRRIRAYRTRYGLSQAKLAEDIEVSPQFIGNLECGRAVPSLDTLISLCYALDASPDSLLQDSLPLCGFCESFPMQLRQPESMFVHTLDRLLLRDAQSVYNEEEVFVGYMIGDESPEESRDDNDSGTSR